MKQTPTFTEKVYQVVKHLKRGQTLTYQEVARLAGNPRACRAVGTILSKNYNPSIPCHRVVRSDGQVGGYNRGGPKAKAKLLSSEKTKWL